MSKDRRLGRGLAALLGSPLHDDGLDLSRPPSSPLPSESMPSAAPTASTLAIFAGDDVEDESPSANAQTLLQLPVQDIEENPFQPRRDFSAAEIASLAESLKEHDMLQPILVRQVAGRYQLISGERRLRAARQAGWTTIPARVREADDRLVAELAIVENLQRQDLNPIEKALSFKRYVDEHKCTQDDLAKRLKIDRSTIANLMRLLELPQTVLDALRNGKITAGHARALLPLGDEREQNHFCNLIQIEGLSVRDIERLISEKLAAEEEAAGAGPTAGSSSSAAKKKRTRSEQTASLEQEFRVALGTRVEIKPGTSGRGKIIIHFSNHDDFDRLREQLTDASPRDPQTKAA